MDEHWLQEFRGRMEGFAARRGDGLALSIKIRGCGEGCLCNGCSPDTSEAVKQFRDSGKLDPRTTEIVEHESGPEFLVYLGVATAIIGAGTVVIAAGTAALTLAKAVVELVTATVKAQAEEKPDKKRGPFVVIVRTINEAGRFVESEALRIEPGKPPSSAKVETSLADAIALIAAERVKSEKRD